MRLAAVVFRIAGVWGVLVLVPMYFLFDQPAGAYDAPIPYPQAYHGFVSVALAWQFAFLVIAADPVRFRPLMIPAMLEKFGYVVASAFLYAQAQIGRYELTTVLPDFVLGALFVLAYLRTPPQRSAAVVEREHR